MYKRIIMLVILAVMSYINAFGLEPIRISGKATNISGVNDVRVFCYDYSGTLLSSISVSNVEFSTGGVFSFIWHDVAVTYSPNHYIALKLEGTTTVFFSLRLDKIIENQSIYGSLIDADEINLTDEFNFTNNVNVSGGLLSVGEEPNRIVLDPSNSTLTAGVLQASDEFVVGGSQYANGNGENGEMISPIFRVSPDGSIYMNGQLYLSGKIMLNSFGIWSSPDQEGFLLRTGIGGNPEWGHAKAEEIDWNISDGLGGTTSPNTQGIVLRSRGGGLLEWGEVNADEVNWSVSDGMGGTTSPNTQGIVLRSRGGGLLEWGEVNAEEVNWTVSDGMGGTTSPNTQGIVLRSRGGGLLEWGEVNADEVNWSVSDGLGGTTSPNTSGIVLRSRGGGLLEWGEVNAEEVNWNISDGLGGTTAPTTEGIVLRSRGGGLFEWGTVKADDLNWSVSDGMGGTTSPNTQGIVLRSRGGGLLEWGEVNAEEVNWNISDGMGGTTAPTTEGIVLRSRGGGLFEWGTVKADDLNWSVSDGMGGTTSPNTEGIVLRSRGGGLLEWGSIDIEYLNWTSPMTVENAQPLEPTLTLNNTVANSTALSIEKGNLNVETNIKNSNGAVFVDDAFRQKLIDLTAMSNQVSIDASLGNVFKISSDNNGVNDVLSISNGVSGQVITIIYYHAPGSLDNLSYDAHVVAGNNYKVIQMVFDGITWHYNIDFI